MRLFIILALFIAIFNSSVAQKLVRYDLVVTDTVITVKGEKVNAIAINGQIPAPTLNFTEGDTAEIHVHNKMMHHETSIHWHGLILPNFQDGVPYLTNPPILANSTFVFKFPIVQSGTYWYHSHSMLQEQSGMYGAFIIHKRDEPKIPEYTLLLSDWTTENPDNIERLLHNATDWYSIKKGATQNYGEAIEKGYLGTKIENEFKRLLPMDVSDVYYNEFRINEQNINQQLKASKGKVKLRIINGSASTYFWLNFAGSKLSVVASDGMDVEPVEVDRMIIAVAETYDVIIDLPDSGSYEFRATAEDRTGFASYFLGEGEKVSATPLKRLNYFEGMEMMNGMMKMNGDVDDMGMNMSLQKMDMNTVMYPELNGEDTTSTGDIVTLNYNMLKSTKNTQLPQNGETKVINIKLSGNMNRYVWTIDNQTISESDKILIKKNENVRIIIYNGSMMRHPMHLHGHFFRVLNGNGDYSPLKNVLDIMPMETDTIEFNASENSGDWYFHCHILYHMMSGMGRIFTYEDSPHNPLLGDHHKAMEMVYDDDRRYFSAANVGLANNGSIGEYRYANTRYQFATEWRLGLNKQNGYEIETHLGRFFGDNQYLLVYIGADIRFGNKRNLENSLFAQQNTSDKREVLCLGARYTLPFLVFAEARLDHTGKFRFELEKSDIALSSRFRLGLHANSDYEYQINGRYIIDKYISISTHYDSEMKFGAGITLTY